MSTFLELENRHTGEILHIQRARDSERQPILLIEGSLPPKASGPPPHVHLDLREEGTVKAGTLGARIGSQRMEIPTGGTAVFPAKAVHNWWNAGDDLLEISGRAVPASDLDRYLQAIFAVMNASPSGTPSLFYLAHVLWRHRHTQVIVAPPLLVQRILFPLILVVGRILGKYRGADWPGSPESCAGAPDAEASAV